MFVLCVKFILCVKFVLCEKFVLLRQTVDVWPASPKRAEINLLISTPSFHHFLILSGWPLKSCSFTLQAVLSPGQLPPAAAVWEELSALRSAVHLLPPGGRTSKQGPEVSQPDEICSTVQALHAQRWSRSLLSADDKGKLNWRIVDCFRWRPSHLGLSRTAAAVLVGFFHGVL